MYRYVAREEAYQNRLAYVADNGNVILKADDTNQLPFGENRTSVRVNTVKDYSGGLFILDLDRAPWGCGIWPAWWSTAVGTGWPALGEIDIIEGVHDNQHNEMAWHTAEGCLLDTEEDFTGNVSIKHNGPATNCWAHLPGSNNVGCSITESSRSFFGPYFESQGGGVFAMKWDENGIAIWSFYRAAIPQDITNGTPNPSSWYKPSALLGPKKCDIEKYFRNHTIILNITFCGDWAGNTYEAAGCPGSCRERLMNPANFVNATWSIRSLKVYRKQLIHAEFVRNGGSSSSRGGPGLWTILALLPLLSIGLLG
ncbi:glycosyl hydrolase family 16 [Coprinopsis cinerea AmutBmut pab1-1]|nr:glycosyl hydrolase family 16 [Coprinopsis cinerea AmutBmut pab1-1]